MRKGLKSVKFPCEKLEKDDRPDKPKSRNRDISETESLLFWGKKINKIYKVLTRLTKIKDAYTKVQK